MKTHSETVHRFRLLLPLVMTGVQLGLLAASLIVHHEPWVLPAPPESQAQAQPDCSGEVCSVSFSPNPPEPRLGRILTTAIVLNLPAVFLGSFLHLLAVFIHLPHPPGEPTDIAFGAVFVPLIWYRVGRWMDDLAAGRIAGKLSTVTPKTVWREFARVIAWFLFATLLLSLLVERHRESNGTRFLVVIAILWAGAYLAGGFLGDRQKRARLRAPTGV
jgi:hypothetical protein